MDAMRNLTTHLDITTSALLNVTLPFEEAGYIRLEGNITGYAMDLHLRHQYGGPVTNIYPQSPLP
jgi:hypothetical protein